MHFKGDIIITDPCYIIRKDEDYKDLESKPKWEDFITCKYEENKKLFLEQQRKLDRAEDDWDEANPDDWDSCQYGEDMEILGINTYLTRDTIYGDWSCTTYNSDTDEVLGHFCADAGLVSVFLLDEVLKYNPKFDYHLNREWTTTLIKDFDGDIEIKVCPYTWLDDDDIERLDEEVRVIGRGNINFETSQTGL